MLFNNTKYGLFLLFTITVPGLAFQAGVGEKTGLMLLIPLYILLFLLPGIKDQKALVLRLRPVQIAWVLALFSWIVINGCFSSLRNTSFDVPRFLGSVMFFAALLMGAVAFSKFWGTLSCRKLHAAVIFTTLILLVSGLSDLVGVHFFGNSKSVSFYNEPSHYALGVAPFLLYAVVVNKRSRYFWLFSFLVVGVFIHNLTIIVVWLLALVISQRLRAGIVMLLVLAAFIIFVVGIHDEYINYYLGRLHFTSQSKNLSALVYLSGWQRALLSLTENYGLGYGFNQLGIVGQGGSIMAYLSEMGAGGLNSLDGGTVASKLIAELGVMGIMLLVFYLRYTLKYVSYLRKVAIFGGNMKKIEIFSYCCIVMYGIDLFVRGTGYFSAESFLFFAALYQVSLEHKGVFLKYTGKMFRPDLPLQQI